MIHISEKQRDEQGVAIATPSESDKLGSAILAGLSNIDNTLQLIATILQQIAESKDDCRCCEDKE